VWGSCVGWRGVFVRAATAPPGREPINALWIVTAAVCVYLLGYRVYAAWIATRVLRVDPTRATPAERLNNGHRRHPVGPADHGPRLHADASGDRVRSSLCRHRRSRAPGRTDACGTVRLPARNAVDPGGRGVRRLRAGYDHTAAVHPSRRPQPRADGAR